MAARSDRELVFEPTLLRQWREALHLDQGAVARALHYDRTTINKIERGAVQPTLRFLEAFERHYKVSARRFLRPGAGRQTGAA
jgi:transcriptional regulator with XRE-family HTH domain